MTLTQKSALVGRTIAAVEEKRENIIVLRFTDGSEARITAYGLNCADIGIACEVREPEPASA
jgi:hypothetical protein